MSDAESLKWVDACAAAGGSNPFCEYALERRSFKREIANERRSDRDFRGTAEVAHSLRQADLSELRKIHPSSIYRALKSFSEWAPLQKVADSANGSDDCALAPLYYGLGLKSEEFFPDRKFRDSAIVFYQKAVKCAGKDVAEADDDYMDKARYRLSLLLIWDGQCEKATPELTLLSQQRSNDYASRALYWRARCAKERNDKLLFNAFRSRLIKDFPLSYHGLLLRDRRERSHSNLLDLQEPMIYFRSAAQPGLNSMVRGIEMLFSLNALEPARSMLNLVADRVENAEAPFRLYMALLLKRTGDMVGHFRILAALFRDNPAALTRSCLELFYPYAQDQFRVLERASKPVRLDPFLIASLIRQESGFNARARSPAGAMGMMQLMPSTARRMARVSRRQLYDVSTNVQLGVRYFNGLVRKFGGDVELALAAYNAGPERVETWKERYVTSDRVLFLDLIPFRETREYVALITRNYYWYLHLYAKPVLEEKTGLARQYAAESNRTRNDFVFSVFNSL